MFFPKNFKQGSDNAAFQSSHCEFSVLVLKEWAAAEGPDLGFWDIRKKTITANIIDVTVIFSSKFVMTNLPLP